MIAEVSLVKSDPLSGRGDKSKPKSLGVTVTGELRVTKKHMIGPYSEGDNVGG